MNELFPIPSLNGTISEGSSQLEGSLSKNGGLSGQLSNDIVYDTYFGPYEIIPKAYDEQVLKTTNKLLADDITVKVIPYAETTNPSGGTTVVIAYEE